MSKSFLQSIAQKSDCVDCAEALATFKRICAEMPDELKEMLGRIGEEDGLIPICPGCLRAQIKNIQGKIHLRKYAE